MQGILALLLCFILNCVSAQPQDAATSFAWLKGGEWKMNTQKGTIVERWKDTSNGDLAGEAYFFDRNGVKKPLEKVLLTCNNNNCWYIPVTTAQNEEKPVRFRLTTVTGRSFVAENPEHDFPKRITYELISRDSIHAWIDDGKPVQGKRNDYYYTRKQQ